LREGVAPTVILICLAELKRLSPPDGRSKAISLWVSKREMIQDSTGGAWRLQVGYKNSFLPLGEQLDVCELSAAEAQRQAEHEIRCRGGSR